MILPNAEQAIVDIRKLRDYCLNDEHPRGKHKARQFKSALGLMADMAQELQDSLVRAVQTIEATESTEDEFGKRYIIDFEMQRDGRQTNIRSIWIIRTGETFPRFVSCYVLK